PRTDIAPARVPGRGCRCCGGAAHGAGAHCRARLRPCACGLLVLPVAHLLVLREAESVEVRVADLALVGAGRVLATDHG
ncbi:MAG: hypothetical protein ACK56F_06880, partial [bacterium]